MVVSRRSVRAVREHVFRRYRAPMASFELDADTTHPPDFALLLNGGLAMYWRRTVLEQAEGELQALGYAHIRLDATDWNEEGLHDAFASALAFPDYYGRNL